MIALGVFLAWFITNGLISIVQYAFPSLPYQLPILIMKQCHVPANFITLITYVPNVMLVVLYFMFRPSRSASFCYWSGWNYMRKTHFAYRVFRCDTANQAFVEIPHYEVWPDWPHLHQQVVYAVAPHAIFAESVTFFFTLNKLFDAVTTIATSLMFWIPIVREIVSMAGVVAATTSNIAHELDSGRSIVILPEGMRAALHVNEVNGVMRVLRGQTGGESEPRKGFIRCATSCKNNVVIVPVYNAGAEKTYTTYNIFPWLQRRMLRNYMFPWPLFSFGLYGSFWPKKTQINVCIGEPISCKGKTVDQIHEEFCVAMESLIATSKLI
ncbi:MAG: 1-acyl-sn-glycerol-3-phosphate acyltransferase [Nitrosomonas sp.]|nr:1-acyl-sn-glycerol-3-phosphate acyltransferase [Nitrosomonas sp.]